MSSQTDMEALDAKIRRLEILFEIQQRESAAEPNNRALQPGVSTGSLDPALQAEISRLRKEIAAKDAVIAAKDVVIAAKDAIIAKRDRKLSVLLKSMGSHEGVLAELVRDMHRSRETAAAQNDDSPQKGLMTEISAMNSDKSCNSVPTLPPKDIMGDGQTGSHIVPFGLSRAKVPAKVPANTGPAPPETTKPNHSPVLRTLKAGPLSPKGTLPPMFTNVVTKVGEQQTPFNPWGQRQSVKSGRASEHKDRKGRGKQPGCLEHRPEKGLTSHGYPQNCIYPLTPRQGTPEATEMTMSTNAEEHARSNSTSATKIKDQLLQESDVDLSVTASKLPVHKNKKYPNGLSPEVASYVANTKGMVLDNEGNEWDAWKVEFSTRLGAPIPPEVKAAIESGALPVSTTDDVKDDSSASSDYDPWGAASLESVDSPPQKLETENSSLINASSPNVKKRSADEEQSGTRALMKRLKST